MARGLSRSFQTMTVLGPDGTLTASMSLRPVSVQYNSWFTVSTATASTVSMRSVMMSSVLHMEELLRHSEELILCVVRSDQYTRPTHRHTQTDRLTDTRPTHRHTHTDRLTGINTDKQTEVQLELVWHWSCMWLNCPSMQWNAIPQLQFMTQSIQPFPLLHCKDEAHDHGHADQHNL